MNLTNQKHADAEPRLTPASLGADVYEAGQRITPQRLKAIQDFAVARDALLAQTIVGNVGVCAGFLEECAVTVVPDTSGSGQAMMLRVGAGAAWDQSGQLCVLAEPVWISAAPLVNEKDATFILELVGHERITRSDRLVREWTGRVQWTQGLGSLPESQRAGVELARVRVNPTTQKLQMVAPDATGTELAPGSVDPRFVQKVVGLATHRLSFAELEAFREALREFRGAMAKVEVALGPLQHTAVLHPAVLMLQSECAVSTPHPERIRFLVDEMRAATLDVLEEVRRKQPSRFQAVDWEQVLLWVQTWTPSGEHPVGASLDPGTRWFEPRFGFQPRSAGIALRAVTRWVVESLLHATYEKERWVLIGEHLHDLRERQTEFHARQVFGGELFQRVVALDAEGLRQQLHTKVLFETQKTFAAPFAKGGVFQGAGRFYSEGELSLQVDGAQLGREGDVIAILQVYKRRARQHVAVRWNGQVVLEEQMPAEVGVNTMMHLGVLIPRASISESKNTLRVDVLKTDLDFGWTGLVLYVGHGGTPSTGGGTQP